MEEYSFCTRACARDYRRYYLYEGGIADQWQMAPWARWCRWCSKELQDMQDTIQAASEGHEQARAVIERYVAVYTAQGIEPLMQDGLDNYMQLWIDETIEAWAEYHS
eukprot:1242163-Rhodomonas_salina.5